MDENVSCPVCHVQVRPTDYFCYNCGKGLKLPPESTTFGKQLILYIGSLLLPPMGIIWGAKYLKQPDQKSKMIGVVAIVLTLFSGVYTVRWALNYARNINDQVNEQMNQLQGF